MHRTRFAASPTFRSEPLEPVSEPTVLLKNSGLPSARSYASSESRSTPMKPVTEPTVLLKNSGRPSSRGAVSSKAMVEMPEIIRPAQEEKGEGKDVNTEERQTIAVPKGDTKEADGEELEEVFSSLTCCSITLSFLTFSAPLMTF